jgi:hypothetical protein
MVLSQFLWFQRSLGTGRDRTRRGPLTPPPSLALLGFYNTYNVFRSEICKRLYSKIVVYWYISMQFYSTRTVMMIFKVHLLVNLLYDHLFLCTRRCIVKRREAGFCIVYIPGPICQWCSLNWAKFYMIYCQTGFHFTRGISQGFF